MSKILFIFGTRPEAIKMAPLVEVFKNDDDFEVQVCITAQHREMLDQVLDFFSIKPDYDLNIMKSNQTLFELTANLIKKLKSVLDAVNPDLVFVQGDTTTAFVGALAAFYRKIKVVHIEAGLRSHNKYFPFPEEMNRILAGHIADYHFAPTKRAEENLRNEGIKDNVWVVGNTVIDALFLGLKIIEGNQSLKKKIQTYFNSIAPNKNSKLILVTGHRRESFGKPFENMCYALREIADKFEDVEIIYPVHLNPNVQKPVKNILGNHPRIHLIEPLSYPYMIWLMSKAFLVLTDSGGIQEEAPSLGKPVLVMRDVTERIEGIEAGTAKLVGTNKEKIVNETCRLIRNEEEYIKMAKAINPYGDGKASVKILEIVKGL